MMHILNIVSAIKKMTINEVREFINEKRYSQIGFPKEDVYYSIKH